MRDQISRNLYYKKKIVLKQSDNIDIKRIKSINRYDFINIIFNSHIILLILVGIFNLYKQK